MTLWANSSPLIGAHFSIAKGLDQALCDARDYGCTTCQIFTKNATTWKEKVLSSTQIRDFKEAKARTGIKGIASHGSYLINLATPEEKKHAQSCHGLENELIRAGQLGIPYVVLHPGAHMGAGEEEGIKRITASINTVFSDTPEMQTKLLLETTSGQGSSVGYGFEQLASIVDGIDDRSRIGICLDSCHIFAAGYDIRSETGYEKTMARFESIIGIHRLLYIHLNDSKNPLGSRIDRHQHIGAGFIGITAFECFMRDPRLRNIPKVIETPKPKGKDFSFLEAEPSISDLAQRTRFSIS